MTIDIALQGEIAMAWHKIGESYYSDAERHAKGTEYFHFLLDVCLPGFLTYLGVVALSGALEHFQFFLLHTTTAKLVYIVAGLFIFSIAYACRKLIVMLAFLAIISAIALGIGGNFLRWLLA